MPGTVFSLALGTNFLAASVAMVVTIILMIVLDLVHPPGLATAMSFALQPGRRSDLAIFVLAVGLTVGLVLLSAGCGRGWKVGRSAMVSVPWVDRIGTVPPPLAVAR